jgi:hypothetical protein
VEEPILLGDDDITVRHSIPLPTGGQPGGSLLRSQSQGAAQGRPGRAGIHTPVQRCVRHNERNVRDHLPERDRELVQRKLRAAWALNNHVEAVDPGAAASLPEGLEDTVTVTRLGISGALKCTLESTNPCESMINTHRAATAKFYGDRGILLRSGCGDGAGQAPLASTSAESWWWSCY